jgi:hypothetical protein
MGVKMFLIERYYNGVLIDWIKITAEQIIQHFGEQYLKGGIITDNKGGQQIITNQGILVIEGNDFKH